RWATRVGLILAMAGNAIGFGNFLRFPVQAVKNGGGAFMIPYVCAIIFLGLPLMWIEWAMGRFGGSRGHGTAPGMFELLWKSRASKYVGLLGLVIPLTVSIYYIYVESWTLAYCYFSANGTFVNMPAEQFPDFFSGLLGGNGYFPIYLFLVITILANFLIMRKGIAGGIEKVAKIALPMLFVMAIILVVRVLTLGSPDPNHPERNVIDGLAFLWNPDFTSLSDPKIWLAATGQVFFTLSVGFGIISCYASYLKPKDDVALSGLTTTATNEFAEVVLGGSLAIPLAFAFLGAAAVQDIANQGAFTLGFITMPLIFQQMPMGQLLSTLWFTLLFFAGITSSLAITQASITFLEDEFDWKREKAVAAVWSFIFLAVQLVVFGPGVIDEMDFWGANVGIVCFGLIEVILFFWVFGSNRAWDEINMSADIRIPKIFFYIMKYITPFYLIVLLVSWMAQGGIGAILMHDVAPEEVLSRWSARVLIILIAVIAAILIRNSRKLREDENMNI
ncbi:MAG: sodium-dependent transporter, partial [Armatimonadota bacterium]